MNREQFARRAALTAAALIIFFIGVIAGAMIERAAFKAAFENAIGQ